MTTFTRQKHTRKDPRRVLGWMLALLTLVLACTLSPRSYADEPASAIAAAPAAAAQAPSNAELERRVLDLEAYMNNSARVDAATTKVPGAGPGHNAWMMVSAALVLFMTLPGLALFYGGLMRRKNVLSVMAQCLLLAGLVTILWWAVGYSIVFHNGGKFMGNFDFAFLKGVDSAPNTDYAFWVSQNVFSMYQLMFAIITPALIVGAIAERMKFSAIFLFMTLWMFVVYFPLAHMVWGIDGFMNGVWNAKAAIRSVATTRRMDAAEKNIRSPASVQMKFPLRQQLSRWDSAGRVSASGRPSCRGRSPRRGRAPPPGRPRTGPDRAARPCCPAPQGPERGVPECLRCGR